MNDQHPAIGVAVRIEYSARHIHLSQKDQDALFGAGYAMKPVKELSQKGQYAYEEKVTVKGPKMQYDVRVLGPCRPQTQLELSFSDARQLGIEASVRVSGDLKDSAGGVTLVGPKGTIELKEGVINDIRHLHISDVEADSLHLHSGDVISVRVPGDTPLIVEHVAVRVHPSFKMNLHLDTDEANAASLDQQGVMGEITAVYPK